MAQRHLLDRADLLSGRRPSVASSCNPDLPYCYRMKGLIAKERLEAVILPAAVPGTRLLAVFRPWPLDELLCCINERLYLELQQFAPALPTSFRASASTIRAALSLRFVATNPVSLAKFASGVELVSAISRFALEVPSLVTRLLLFNPIRSLRIYQIFRPILNMRADRHNASSSTCPCLAVIIATSAGVNRIGPMAAPLSVPYITSFEPSVSSSEFTHALSSVSFAASR